MSVVLDQYGPQTCQHRAADDGDLEVMGRGVVVWFFCGEGRSAEEGGGKQEEAREFHGVAHGEGKAGAPDGASAMVLAA